MPKHHPPGTTPARHTRAPQAPHTCPPACARRQPPVPHVTVRPQVPPTASHRMPPLCTPAASTNGPTLQPRPLGLPRSRTPPQPLFSLRGLQPPPPRAATGPSRTSPRQPPQLLRATHQRPPGPPGRVLRGGRGGPRMDHSHGHGQRTPAPRDAGSNSHKFARIRIRPEFARIRGPLRTRIRNFKFESSLIRLIESIGTYNLPSRLQFTCFHMGMPQPSTISHKRYPKSFRNLAILVVCCCLHLPC